MQKNQSPDKNKIIVILGPTSSGKTKLAVLLAKKFNGEIISADSRQVYRGMDVGTGKDLAEYIVKIQNPACAGRSKFKSQNYHRQGGIPPSFKNKLLWRDKSKIKNIKIRTHLLDIVSPKKQFTVADYQKLAYKAIDDVLSRGKLPIICGGTGLYISALVEGYVLPQSQISNLKSQKLRKRFDKLNLKQLLSYLKRVDSETYKVIDKNNRRRVQRALEIYFQTGLPKSKLLKKQSPPYQFLLLGLNPPKEILHQRIEKRFKRRLEKEGMIDEVKKLHHQGVGWKRLQDFGLEYRWLSLYLQKKINYEEMVRGLQKAIKDFAKRQMTWFKRDKRIIWVINAVKISRQVKEFLKNH